jgi:hypothetical protein
VLWRLVYHFFFRAGVTRLRLFLIVFKVESTFKHFFRLFYVVFINLSLVLTQFGLSVKLFNVIEILSTFLYSGSGLATFVKALVILLRFWVSLSNPKHFQIILTCLSFFNYLWPNIMFNVQATLRITWVDCELRTF